MTVNKMLKKQSFYIFAGILSVFSAFQLGAAPVSITNTGSITQVGSITADQQQIKAENIKINGLQGGRITNTGNKLIVQGGTIVSRPGEKKPAIQIENPKNKEIILENTRIISDGAILDNQDGSSALIIIENGHQVGNNSSRVRVKNVHVTANNSTIRAKASGGTRACAGVVCTGFDDDDESNNVVVRVRGKNTFEAISK